MAKYAKRRKKQTKTRRRRVGATASIFNPRSPMLMYGGLAIGFLMGNKVNDMIDKIVPASIDGKLVGAGQAGLGALLLQKKKSTLTVLGGALLVGSGAKRLMTEFGIGSIGGYQMVPTIAGYQKVPSIAGAQRVNGYTPGTSGLNGYTMQRDVIGGLSSAMDGGLIGG